ncbi:hypothetical protein MW887_011567 [Aspergillus wentii]|nr:hypothetical protein MW887_011567 [Aspergillus wentii]
MSITADIVTRRPYGHSCNYLDESGFNKKWKDAVLGTVASRLLFRQFPLLNVLTALPLSLLVKLNPGIADMKQLFRQLSIQKVNTDTSRKNDSKTIFDGVNNPDIPPDQRTSDHLLHEGRKMLIAGTEMTANALTTSLCYLVLPEYQAALSNL